MEPEDRLTIIIIIVFEKFKTYILVDYFFFFLNY